MTAPVKPSKAREKILDAACRLFYTEGIHAVSIDRLSEEAQVSKRSVYQYFDGRDTILTQMLEERGSQLLARYLPADADEDARPRERILYVFDALTAVAASPQFHGCPFTNTAIVVKDREHPAFQVAARHKRLLTNFFSSQARLAGVREPDNLAATLTAIFDGACAHTVFTGEPPHFARSAAIALMRAEGI